jgi:predicted dehydrogenase
MTNDKMRVGIIGCGNISGPYARSLAEFPQLQLAGCADLVPARAEALAAQHGCRAYQTNEALLADPHVDIVVNLAIHHAHYAVTTQALEAGKHVFTEKPMALSYPEARELVELAVRKGLRLGSAPFTYMGEAQQTGWKLIREGRLGTVRAAYAEVNWGRIEAWHPAPEPFYAVGPLFDVGVYPLTLLTTIFGPVRRVRSYGTVLYPDRVTTEGRAFHITTPDFGVTMLEFGGGLVARLTTNFYVPHRGSKQSGVEFHGDLGSLYMAAFDRFDSVVEFGPYGQPYEAVPLLKEPYHGIQWGRGVADLADAIREGRPHRATGQQAAHVVEILTAAAESMRTERSVGLTSAFPQPAPMDWAR